MNSDITSREGFLAEEKLGKMLEKLHITTGIPVEIYDIFRENGREWRLRTSVFIGRPFQSSERYRMYLAPK